MKNLTYPTMDYENSAQLQGYNHIAGADEAGRGPLAGPVVAAAVILPKHIEGEWINTVRDSKEMKESEREVCYDEIIKHALAFAIVEVSNTEIDEVNILQASLQGMKRATEQLRIKADYLLVDGKQYPPIDLPGVAIVKGDQKSLSISAASILAKVTRDRIMCSLHEQYPQYGWKVHKGYPTKYHRIAIQLFGTSPLHRMTFNGVKNVNSIQTTSLFQSLDSQIKTLTTKNQIKHMNEKLIPHRSQLCEEEYFYLQQTLKYLSIELTTSERKQQSSTRQTGDQYESVAAEYLINKGYRIVRRNYHTPNGEIDIIAETKDLLVFVEVKARKGSSYGEPHEAVSKSKIKKIMAAAEQYLYEEKPNCDKDIRYDVMSVFAQKAKSPQITHYEDAFRTDTLF